MFFQLSLSEKSWYDGVLECSVMAANLVTIDDEIENQYVMGKTKSISSEVWIGISEIVNIPIFVMFRLCCLNRIN